MRMDKYKDNNDIEETVNNVENNYQEEEVLTRSVRNKDIYRDDYEGVVKVLDPNDLSNLFSQNKEEVKERVEEQVYVPKDYSIDNYIEKAHEGLESDNIIRSLDKNNRVDIINAKKDDISKLMDSIQEKSNNSEEELFGDLMPDDDNEDTLTEDPLDESKLDSVIGDDTFADFAIRKQEEKEKNNIFEDLDKIEGNNRRIPLIVLSISLGLLVIITIVVLLIKFL